MNEIVSFIILTLSLFLPIKTSTDIHIITESSPTITIPSQKPTSTPSLKPLPTLISTKTPTLKPSPPINKLIYTVNKFRQSHGKHQITSHPVLCSIAEQRIRELIQRGNLDNHEGYNAHEDALKKSFTQWWETLFFAYPQKTAHDIVFIHWANSQGHRDSLLSNATHGCGSEKNGFAVFELGKE
ncbi:MAG: CAP domain-containing protein [Patescibacteria group bacterium]|nr:CAP domain-containing protein [Patescibacteria group bacterium]